MSRRHEIPQQPILFVKFSTFGELTSWNRSLSVVDTHTFSWSWTTFQDGWKQWPPRPMMPRQLFGVPKALINDQGSHFYNRAMSSLLEKYGVVHQIAIAYHPQTNGQVEKLTNPNRKDWSRHLEDTLWAHRIAYRTPLGMSPYQIVFGKARHLPNTELIGQSRSATWPTTKLGKKGSFNYKSWRNFAYENSRIYKHRVKQFHDCQILRKEFHVGQKSALVQIKIKAHHRTNLQEAPSKSTGSSSKSSMKAP
ncbi:hypothetical protein CR513_45698, partial [Mucuna pruriens]